MLSNKTVYIWTDGSCDNGVHQKGGYGVVMKYKENTTSFFGGRFDNTTSARMELKGVIEALKKLKPSFDAIISVDNQYVVNSIAKGWVFNWEKQNFKKRENSDLWREFLEVYRRWDNPEKSLHFNWVRGHNGNEMNELADDLARQGGSDTNIIQDMPNGYYDGKHDTKRKVI